VRPAPRRSGHRPRQYAARPRRCGARRGSRQPGERRQRVRQPGRGV